MAKARSNLRFPGAEVFSDEQWSSLHDDLGLSLRECEILRAVFEDAKETAIAEDLNISPHTVHTHLERLRRKLGVRNRAQLIIKVAGEVMQNTAQKRL